MWHDFFKVFKYAFTDDPITRSTRKDLRGAGATSELGIPDLRAGADSNSGGGSTAIGVKDTTDMVDLSTVTNRLHRYKEYERLLNMPEIDTAMTVFADEACFSGDEEIITPHGSRTLKDLAQNEKDRFLCYSYDMEKQDYTLAWAYNARKTKRANTVKVILDNGQSFICTPDHRILMKNHTWVEAGQLKEGSELMPFYRLKANHDLTKIKTNQFPRIWTKNKGWINEKQFINDWKSGKTSKEMEIINRYCRMISQGLSVRQISKLTKNDFETVRNRIRKHGFSNKELKWLGTKEDHRRVVNVIPNGEIDVYDISVEKHMCFATNWGIAHNCQKDDDGRVFSVNVENEEIKKELEWLLFHRTMLNFDQKKIWNMAKQLFTFGDFFYEVVIDIDDPKSGIINLVPLPPETMYRIETTKSKLIEFQQSKEGPDYQSLSKVDITQATDADLQQATAIRFTPDQIIHIRIGEDRKTFYPYGVSLIETARGPAHQLRMMEDAMIVYRLTRAPERRVFYIDVGGIHSYKAEALMERIKDQFKKKKVPARNNLGGASSVEERWHAPSADEDIFIPIRPNVNTRVETLPGAQNLGEIDDTLYFRGKLFTALNFPKNYFNNEDTQSTRISLSSQDVKFARLIERLQSYIEDAFWEICNRHLKLLGYPEEAYEDLTIKFTAPSDWRELTRAEVISNRVNIATTLQGSKTMSNYDILTKWMKYSDQEAKDMLARLSTQLLDELKMQVLSQNPNLLGVGLPGPNETEVGVEPGGPNPNLNPQEETPMPQIQGMKKFMDEGENDPTENAPANKPMSGSGNVIPEPSEEDIKRFDLDIQDFAKEIDIEEIDDSESES